MSRQIRFTPNLDNSRFLEKLRRAAEERAEKKISDSQLLNGLLDYIRTEMEDEEATQVADQVLRETGA